MLARLPSSLLPGIKQHMMYKITDREEWLCKSRSLTIVKNKTWYLILPEGIKTIRKPTYRLPFFPAKNNKKVYDSNCKNRMA
jgi:hypothetical protein